LTPVSCHVGIKVDNVPQILGTADRNVTNALAAALPRDVALTFAALPFTCWLYMALPADCLFGMAVLAKQAPAASSRSPQSARIKADDAGFVLVFE
jgi:hypothetical protein